MFNGRWNRVQTDTVDQLENVLGISKNPKLVKESMRESLEEYLKAKLTTIIHQDGVDFGITRRYIFENDEDEVEEQITDFKFGENKLTINERSISGSFTPCINGLQINGNEGPLKVTYKIQEGKLIEILTGNGFNFKQISEEEPKDFTLFMHR
ncbi:Oidioi.mRNA.OKI2018_I69.chr2.g4024.t1.cds [Oikopleura dioica]|uniref:Oidioi.mRNA.OKI2018_I69.chr2.g4024.t1.cds n=1 Tax=Oikopleura dioica TaxID=34765 RepID=A0ABN7SWI2_OIKDI|nr:Oidioi.mRNA.OKI2018_I69.chr2.g4024.t1.cds [Oikopleura dioica]